MTDAKKTAKKRDRKVSANDLKALNKERRGDGAGVQTGFQKKPG